MSRNDYRKSFLELLANANARSCALKAQIRLTYDSKTCTSLRALKQSVQQEIDLLSEVIAFNITLSAPSAPFAHTRSPCMRSQDSDSDSDSEHDSDPSHFADDPEYSDQDSDANHPSHFADDPEHSDQDSDTNHPSSYADDPEHSDQDSDTNHSSSYDDDSDY